VLFHRAKNAPPARGCWLLLRYPRFIVWHFARLRKRAPCAPDGEVQCRQERSKLNVHVLSSGTRARARRAANWAGQSFVPCNGTGRFERYNIPESLSCDDNGRRVTRAPSTPYWRISSVEFLLNSGFSRIGASASFLFSAFIRFYLACSATFAVTLD